MHVNMLTPDEMAKHISHLVRAKRLSLNYSQKTLSELSGVSFSVIKKFELTGKISLESLLKLALVLDSLNDFTELFKVNPTTQNMSLDDLIASKERKRGRR